MILSKDYMLLRKYFDVLEINWFFFFKIKCNLYFRIKNDIDIKIRMVLNYGEVVEGKFIVYKEMFKE